MCEQKTVGHVVEFTALGREKGGGQLLGALYGCLLVAPMGPAGCGVDALDGACMH